MGWPGAGVVGGVCGEGMSMSGGGGAISGGG